MANEQQQSPFIAIVTQTVSLRFARYLKRTFYGPPAIAKQTNSLLYQFHQALIAILRFRVC